MPRVFGMMPVNMARSYAETADSAPVGLVEDGALDGIKVRIRKEYPRFFKRSG